MNAVMHDEARHKTRLMFYPKLASRHLVEAGYVLVVASVEAFGEGWLTLTQQGGGGNRRGIFMWEDVAVMERGESEWALLAMLGVERLGDNLEWWPANAQREAHVRGQFVVPCKVALAQGLRVQWA